MNREKLNELSNKIIGIGIKIHKALGPGFLESIYEKAMVYEFEREHLKFKQQAVIRVNYRDLQLGNQRVDFIVNNEIILELKTISEIMELHQAQLLSYLKTVNKRLGLVLNFGKKKLEIKRVVNNF